MHTVQRIQTSFWYSTDLTHVRLAQQRNHQQLLKRKEALEGPGGKFQRPFRG